MKQTRRGGLFPPSIGWVPILIALAVVTVISTVMVVPQYATHQVLGMTAGPGGGGPAGAPGNETAVPTDSAGHPLTNGGQPTAHGGGAATPAASGGDCAHGKNAGATDKGVTATAIHIATTDVTTGVGAGFLGQAVQGMKAAIAQVNQAGGVCGRRITLDSINDGWDGPTGANDISGFINSGTTFALVGEPDSEGLDAAVRAGTIDRAGIPVVGTDGMLASQYNDPWIWPVAASTVTNMHIAAQYGHGQLKGQKFGIVFDSVYKFGKEGANAYRAEIQRLTGGTGGLGNDCSTGYCGVSPASTDYSSSVTAFNKYCEGPPKCDVVMMLLEPQPMLTWMKDEENCSCSWYGTLMGGEPLFDDNLAGNCAQDCAGMMVWTGYKPDIQPFDGETPVYTFAHSLAQTCPSCDPHNEFTEGAYLGTKLFIAACAKVGANLTRASLRDALNSGTFDLGLSQPLHYSSSLPHLANVSMAAYSDNASGTFNGWSYRSTGFIPDPALGQDLSQ
jgi:ABC-type branched-subunit amino acid transport system substrate-binding protein